MMPLNNHVGQKGLDKTMPYEGTVVDNNDPRKIAQIRVRVAGIMDSMDDSELPWARPRFRHSEGLKGGEGVNIFGHMAVPQRGAKVNLYFPTGQPYEATYDTDVRMGENDTLPEFLINYPHRVGFRMSHGLQLIIDRSTSEMFLINPGDMNLTVMGDLNQQVIGNQQLIVSGNKGDIPDYILNDPVLVAKALTPDPKGRIKFKGLLGGSAGNQHTEISGNQTTLVKGNRKTIVQGTDTLEVKKSMKIEVSSDVTVNGSIINLN